MACLYLAAATALGSIRLYVSVWNPICFFYLLRFMDILDILVAVIVFLLRVAMCAGPSIVHRRDIWPGLLV